METGENNKFQCYIEERKLLYNAVIESGKLFDKSILTISAGTFGLTITFLRNIAPENKNRNNFYVALCMDLFLNKYCCNIVLIFNQP